jgi:hypothetical protein
VTDTCPYAATCAWGATRHEHPYKPPAAAQRQCTCGSRKWTVRAGGGLNVSVFCARCTRRSRISSAYEQGRMAGVTATPAATEEVPF